MSISNRSTSSSTDTHYGWVAQLWSRGHSYLCDPSAYTGISRSECSAEALWCDLTGIEIEGRLLSGFVCPLHRIPSQLYRSARTRREKPISNRDLRFRPK